MCLELTYTQNATFFSVLVVNTTSYRIIWRYHWHCYFTTRVIIPPILILTNQIACNCSCSFYCRDEYPPFWNVINSPLQWIHTIGNDYNDLNGLLKYCFHYLNSFKHVKIGKLQMRRPRNHHIIVYNDVEIDDTAISQYIIMRKWLIIAMSY